MTSELPRGYIGYLPPFFEQADAAGQQVLDRYLWIFQHLLGPAPDPGKPAPPATVVRRAMATVLDALPDLFHPRLSFLFPESRAFIPPLADSEGPGGLQWRKISALNDYFGILVPQGGEDVEGEAWQTAVTAAVSAWLSALLGWQAAWIGLQSGNAWTLDDQRGNLATILPVFRQRGTAAGLEKLLNILAPGSGPIPKKATIRVRDVTAGLPMTVGRSTTLQPGYPKDGPVLGSVRPFSFVVELSGISGSRPRAAAKAFLRGIVDREKPAHTTYTINVTS